MIRNDSIRRDQKLDEHQELLPSATGANASFEPGEADSDFLVKVRIVLCTVGGSTERFFEILIRSLGKSMMKSCNFVKFLPSGRESCLR